MLANVYLEGTYSEVYPHITQDALGIHRLFHQFSTPGGVPSHVSVPTPGSIHEGGELGYALVHAFGAVFDNPDLVAACVIGDGEAETGPMSGSWQGINFLNPVRDGAVLPILHLNGYKISGPTVLGRRRDEAVRALLTGHGYDPHFVEGDDPAAVHALLAATLDDCFDAISSIQAEARSGGFSVRPRWPAIVLRTPKGWTGPKVVDGVPVEGTFRAHQVPLANVRDNPDHLLMLDEWMRSYRPDELFDDKGVPVAALRAVAPVGDRRMGANPHANGGVLLQPLDLPDWTDYTHPRRGARPRAARVDPAPGPHAAGRLRAQPGAGQLPADVSRRDQLEPAGRGVRGREPLPGRAAPRRPTTTWRPTAGSWRSSASTTARGGWRATCSPAATGCSPPTRRSPWCRRR